MKEIFVKETLITMLKKHIDIIAWVIFGAAITFSFWWVEQARQDTKVQICKSQLDAALTLRDLIDYSLAASSNPEAQVVVQRFYDRIELPPKICAGTSVDVEEFFRRDILDPEGG